MKYDQKYPGASSLDEPEQSLVRGGLPGRCECGELTHWVNADYQTHVCSEECLKELKKKPLERTYWGQITGRQRKA